MSSLTKVAQPRAFLAHVRKSVHDHGLPLAVGKVVEVLGASIVVSDLLLPVGSFCEVERDEGRLLCEVVSLREGSLGPQTIVMPYGVSEGIRAHAPCYQVLRPPTAPVGNTLLGRVLDGLGRPRDGRELLTKARRSLRGSVSDPLRRRPINQPLATGVRAIDAFATLGPGQRVGILAGAGVGKSTLLSMIARGNSADVNVVALIGERNREVQEFISHALGDAISRSVIVVSTSDEPDLMKVRAAHLAATIAEHFRDEGKTVAFFCDSITRFALAQSAVGIAAGELPTVGGYTPSVRQALPHLFERAGMGEVGAITAFHTVLVASDRIIDDPVADEARSRLDGQIVLSRDLHEHGQFPPVDVISSMSRVMPSVTSTVHVQDARELRRLIAAQRDAQVLIDTGSYAPGADLLVDAARTLEPALRIFLSQDRDDLTSFADTQDALHALAEKARSLIGSSA